MARYTPKQRQQNTSWTKPTQRHVQEARQWPKPATLEEGQARVRDINTELSDLQSRIAAGTLEFWERRQIAARQAELATERASIRPQIEVMRQAAIAERQAARQQHRDQYLIELAELTTGAFNPADMTEVLSATCRLFGCIAAQGRTFTTAEFRIIGALRCLLVQRIADTHADAAPDVTHAAILSLDIESRRDETIALVQRELQIEAPAIRQKVRQIVEFVGVDMARSLLRRAKTSPARLHITQFVNLARDHIPRRFWPDVYGDSVGASDDPSNPAEWQELMRKTKGIV